MGARMPTLFEIATRFLLGKHHADVSQLLSKLEGLLPVFNALRNPIHHYYQVELANVPTLANPNVSSSGAYIFPLAPMNARRLIDLVGNHGALMAKMVNLGKSIHTGRSDLIEDVFREIFIGAAALSRLRFEFPRPVTPHFALTVDWFAAPRLERRVSGEMSAEFVLDGGLADVMEYVLAERADISISRLLKDPKYQHVDLVVAIVFQTVYSVCAANAILDFVHGDLHLGNVMARLLRDSGDQDADATWHYQVPGERSVRLPPSMHHGVCVKIIDFGRSSGRCSVPLVMKLDATDSSTTTTGSSSSSSSSSSATSPPSSPVKVTQKRGRGRPRKEVKEAPLTLSPPLPLPPPVTTAPQGTETFQVGDSPDSSSYGTSHPHDLQLFSFRLLVSISPWLAKQMHNELAVDLVRVLLDMAAFSSLVSMPARDGNGFKRPLMLLCDRHQSVLGYMPLEFRTKHEVEAIASISKVAPGLRKLAALRTNAPAKIVEVLAEMVANQTASQAAYLIDRYIYSNGREWNIGVGSTTYNPTELFGRVCSLVDQASTRARRADKESAEKLMGVWNAVEESTVDYDDQ